MEGLKLTRTVVIKHTILLIPKALFFKPSCEIANAKVLWTDAVSSSGT